MSDRKIDPTTGDFVDGPNGTFAAGDVIDNKIFLSNTVELGTWEGAPDIGIRTSVFRRTTDTSENRARAVDIIKQAHQWLVDSGELDRVEVSLTSFDRGIWTYEVDAYEPGNAKPRTFGPYFTGAKS
jgi:phage gp46-like protein